MAPVPAPRAGRTVASPRVSATSGLRAEPVGGRLAASSLSALLYSLNAPEWPAMAGRQAELRRVAAAAAAGTAVGRATASKPPQDASAYELRRAKLPLRRCFERERPRTAQQHSSQGRSIAARRRPIVELPIGMSSAPRCMRVWQRDLLSILCSVRYLSSGHDSIRSSS